MQIGTWDDSDPSGGHGFYYAAGLSTAVDYDASDAAEGTGKLLTARRAFDIITQIVETPKLAGGQCGELRLGGVDRREVRQLAMEHPAQALIRNVRVIPSTTTAKFYYTAPDGRSCKVGSSASPFTSTDDSGDTSDSQSNPARSVSLGVTSGATYYYRITCGPLGGAARASGSFTAP